MSSARSFRLHSCHAGRAHDERAPLGSSANLTGRTTPRGASPLPFRTETSHVRRRFVSGGSCFLERCALACTGEAWHASSHLLHQQLGHLHVPHHQRQDPRRRVLEARSGAPVEARAARCEGFVEVDVVREARTLGSSESRDVQRVEILPAHAFLGRSE